MGSIWSVSTPALFICIFTTKSPPPSTEKFTSNTDEAHCDFNYNVLFKNNNLMKLLQNISETTSQNLRVIFVYSDIVSSALYIIQRPTCEKGSLPDGSRASCQCKMCDNKTYHTVCLRVPLGVEKMKKSTRRDQGKKGIRVDKVDRGPWRFTN